MHIFENVCIIKNLVAEAHGHDSQTGRKLYSAETDNVFPTARRR